MLNYDAAVDMSLLVKTYRDFLDVLHMFSCVMRVECVMHFSIFS